MITSARTSISDDQASVRDRPVHFRLQKINVVLNWAEELKRLVPTE